MIGWRGGNELKEKLWLDEMEELKEMKESED